MKTRARTGLGALLALAGWLVAGEAEAANPAYLNINVTVNANVSVSVNDAASSTMTVSWNAATPNDKLVPVSLASATVTNDSGGVTEKWRLSTNQYSLSAVAGSTWTLAASSSSVGADEFAVQAVFGSSNTAATSCLSATHADWNSTFAPVLTTSLQTYTTTTFAAPSLVNNGTSNPDQTSGTANGRMFAGSKRALCWRIISPSSTSTAETQNVQVIVTAALL